MPKFNFTKTIKQDLRPYREISIDPNVIEQVEGIFKKFQAFACLRAESVRNDEYAIFTFIT